MQDLVEQLTNLLLEKKMMLTTVESCTGGLLAAEITHRAGASKVFERGFVTYSNEAKVEMLGVPEETLRINGAVSVQTADAMARGALKNAHAGLSVSITGVAGPEGGTQEKPVGLVYIGYALEGGMAGSAEHRFSGTREEIRRQALAAALEHLISALQDIA